MCCSTSLYPYEAGARFYIPLLPVFAASMIRLAAFLPARRRLIVARSPRRPFHSWPSVIGCESDSARGRAAMARWRRDRPDRRGDRSQSGPCDGLERHGGRRLHAGTGSSTGRFPSHVRESIALGGRMGPRKARRRSRFRSSSRASKRRSLRLLRRRLEPGEEPSSRPHAQRGYLAQ